MDESIYYPHEEKMIHMIDYFFDDNFIFCITGNSGCGKSFTLKKYFSNSHKDYLFLYFVGDYLQNDKEYNPFLTGLSAKENRCNREVVQKGMVELSKDIPYIGNISTYIVKNLINNAENLSLNPIEQEIISKIQFLIQQNNVILFLDDLHWWDKRSIQLLDIIIRQIDFSSLKNKLKIFFAVTPNQSTLNQQYLQNIIEKACAKHLEFPILEYADFKRILRIYLKPSDDKIDKQLSILYKTINNHMKILHEIIKELKKGKSVLSFDTASGQEYLKELLEDRLREYGATGKLISKVLEYASIIGISFSYYELEKIINLNSQEFRKIILHAKEMELIETTSEKDIAIFAHQIIRELFESRVKSNNLESIYYLTLEQCISQIKPAEFLRRARYLVKAGELEKASILYLLEFLQEMRNYNGVNPDLEIEAEPLLSEELSWYIEHMKKANVYHTQKNYEAALEELDLIEEFYSPSLIAEKKLLQSFCYTKSLDKDIRIHSLECIESFEELKDVDNEIEVYERIQNRLISVYAHLGRLKEAAMAEYRLMQNLRLRYQYDENARVRLNIARRTYNIIHDCKSSMTFMEKAMEYFAPEDKFSVPVNLKHYYISLVNYSSILTSNGLFEQGNNYMKEAFKLEKNFTTFIFPRQQILYNNYIISSYLCGKMKVSECISALESIIAQLPLIAERLTYTSNLSIFYALSNNIEKAKEILVDEIIKQNVEHDVEGFYKYRSFTNLAIYQYLLGNKCEAIERLHSIADIISSLNNNIYYQKHHDIIIGIMEKCEITSSEQWLTCVHSIMPNFKSDAWNYFGMGYVFASLFNWDTEN